MEMFKYIDKSAYTKLIQQFPNCEIRMVRRRLTVKLPRCTYPTYAARFAYFASFLPAYGWAGVPIISSNGDQTIVIEGDLNVGDNREM